MRKKLLLCCLYTFLAALCLAGASKAQTELDAYERKRLCELLRINATTKINAQSVAELAARESYKVYLGFGLDFATRNQLARWVERWNAKQGRELGRLEVVEDLTAAQLILSGFRVEAREDAVATVPPNRLSGPISHAATAKEVYVPILFYVLTPAENGLTVIQRGRYDEKQTAQKEPSTALADSLRESLIGLLKKRPKAH